MVHNTIGGPNLSPCPYRITPCPYRPHQFWCGTVRGPQIQTDNGPPFGAVRFAVLNTKRLTMPILVRYGSRSNTKKRTVKIKGSVRFALLTIGQKNGAVTVALAVKNGSGKKKGKTVRTRYGTATVAATNSDPPVYCDKDFST